MFTTSRIARPESTFSLTASQIIAISKSVLAFVSEYQLMYQTCPTSADVAARFTDVADVWYFLERMSLEGSLISYPLNKTYAITSEGLEQLRRWQGESVMLSGGMVINCDDASMLGAAMGFFDEAMQADSGFYVRRDHSHISEVSSSHGHKVALTFTLWVPADTANVYVEARKPIVLDTAKIAEAQQSNRDIQLLFKNANE